MNSKIKKILIFLSFIGILDAIYLSIPKIYNTSAYCIASEPSSCDLVLNSNYSEIFFGIPNAFMGVLFYLSLFLIFIFWNKIQSKLILKFIIFISSLASIFYIHLIYLQKFIIKSYCPYCLLSAFITFTISIILIKIYLKEKK